MVKKASRNSEVDRRQLANLHAKIEELSLKLHPLTDDSENVAQLQTQVTSKEVECTASRDADLWLNKAPDAKYRAHASLQPEPDSLHGTGECWEGVSGDFVNGVCIAYSGLMRTHSASYLNRIKVPLSDAQSKVEYARPYQIHVG